MDKNSNNDNGYNDIKEALKGCFSWKGSPDKLWRDIRPKVVKKTPWYKRTRRWIAVCTILLMAFAIYKAPFTSVDIKEPAPEVSKGTKLTTDTINDNALPSVGSYENLLSILEENSQHYNDRFYFAHENLAGIESDVKYSSTTDSVDYSKTNIQVDGVDEADIVKTDGEYIYYVKGKKILVVKAVPAQEIKIVNTITIDDDNFIPRELYLNDDYLVVIGGSARDLPKPDVEKDNSKDKEGSTDAGALNSSEVDSKPSTLIDRGYHFPMHTTKVFICNIKNPSDIELLREFEMDGYYLSSRKVDSHLYLVSNRYGYHNFSTANETDLVPFYRDSIKDEGFKRIDYSDIKYFPDSKESNYLLIAGLDLNNINKEADLSTYLGSGGSIYASRDNLYVSVTNWGSGLKVTTTVYKFNLNKGRIAYSAKGEVPGTLLNQFSMDEYSDHFRVATTTGDSWRNDEHTSKNHMYILDKDMQITGRLENIAPGERIYSVRFMGEKAYMVTFKTVDPLFVIDLKEPKSPKILGELKIPGYSDYLHPYDENHIIGFGMDAIEVDIKDQKGNVIGKNAYQLGMKIAMFDVRDVKSPVEKFKINIGDRGTHSDVLGDHKALMYSDNKNLMAFPVIVSEAEQKWLDSEKTMPNYGELAFQGAYVIGIDIEKGFTVDARITHVEDMDTKYPKNIYNFDKHIKRILYIEDTIYTLSNDSIMAHDMVNDYKELGRCELNRLPLKESNSSSY